MEFDTTRDDFWVGELLFSWCGGSWWCHIAARIKGLFWKRKTGPSAGCNQWVKSERFKLCVLHYFCCRVLVGVVLWGCAAGKCKAFGAVNLLLWTCKILLFYMVAPWKWGQPVRTVVIDTLGLLQFAAGWSALCGNLLRWLNLPSFALGPRMLKACGRSEHVLGEGKSCCTEFNRNHLICSSCGCGRH